jgi:carbamoyltransferase
MTMAEREHVILGVWDGHDSGAALLRDGEILFAANEERFSRKKLDVEFPGQSIRESLKFTGLTPADISVVAISTSDFAKTLTRVLPGFKRRYYLIRRRKVEPSAFNRFSKRAKYVLTEIGPGALSRKASSVAVGRELRRLGFEHPRLVWVGHHDAHAASAVATSRFSRGLVLSLDGIGDGLSGLIGTFDGASVKILQTYSGKNSLGLFFEHVTNLLNMRELEDEGKVMALASFGYPVPDEENPLLSWFEVDGLVLRARHSSWTIHERLARTLYLYPAEQFAYMAQRVLEVTILKLVENACRATGLSDVVYAGGVASNIKVNMLLKNSPAVKNLYVFPHMGDGGLALGAALRAGQMLANVSRYPLPDLFLGPSYSATEVERAIKASGLPHARVERIEDRVAELIRDGRIVLWFRGRMEYGPRALGHRSILARADSVAIKDRLNVYLKKRVWYQPFCPTMLAEDAAEMLEDYNGVDNPFMTVGYKIKDIYADRLAAVINADHSCRPQILSDENSSFGRLLRKVKDLTGHGVVLNTSMNKHGESIINTPDEALALLAGSRFEYLAIENFLVEKG